MLSVEKELPSQIRFKTKHDSEYLLSGIEDQQDGTFRAFLRMAEKGIGSTERWISLAAISSTLDSLPTYGLPFAADLPTEDGTPKAVKTEPIKFVAEIFGSLGEQNMSTRVIYWQNPQIGWERTYGGEGFQHRMVPRNKKIAQALSCLALDGGSQAFKQTLEDDLIGQETLF